MESKLSTPGLQKLYQKGEDELKTSFFKLKFNPDYLAAVGYFTAAGKGFQQNGAYKESIRAYNEAIKCNLQINDSWSEGQNSFEVAKMLAINLNDFAKGWEPLRNASQAFKIAGQFCKGIKVYTDLSKLLIEMNRYEEAYIPLRQAFEECVDYTHDSLIRLSLDETYSQYLDVLCALENYTDAIEIAERYIKILLECKDESKSKISKNYIKLGMLRIIVDEIYMAEKIINKMFGVYDKHCNEDISDLNRLISAFKTMNKKDFIYSMTCAFSLFQNNLLKGLKKAYEKQERERGISSSSISTNCINNNLVQTPSNPRRTYNTSNDLTFSRTKANSFLDFSLTSRTRNSSTNFTGAENWDQSEDKKKHANFYI